MIRAFAILCLIGSLGIPTAKCAEPAGSQAAGSASGFQVGFAIRDITPQKPVPNSGRE